MNERCIVAKTAYGFGVVSLSFSSFFYCSVASAKHGFAELGKIKTPDRQKVTQSGVSHLQRSANRSSASSVQMSQGNFLLNTQYLPELKEQQGYVLLQFVGPVQDEWRQQLASLNVTLLDYIPDNTWTSRINRAQLEQVKSLAFVHAMGSIYPIDKLPSKLLSHELSPRAKQGSDKITLEVSFHQGETYGNVVNQLSELSASTQQIDFISGQRLLITLPEQHLVELAYLDSVRWIEEPATPKIDQNIDAAELSKVSVLHQEDPTLLGNGVTIAGWESAVPQIDHPDLKGRVTIAEHTRVSSHATHIAGTIVGSGENNPVAKGMAPEANYIAYTSSGDIPMELQRAVQQYDIMLSNHSWGYINGWSYNYYKDDKWTWFGQPNEDKDANFGRYSTVTQQWDKFVAESNTIVVKSASNNRDDAGALAGTGHTHYGDSNTLHYDYHGPDGDYDSLDVVASAKNVITVGAVDDSGEMTGYSGWGPTDDGRIKPDIVANGSSLYSTMDNSSYGSMSGTSMSAPTVSGGLALLVELYRRIYGEDPHPDTLKALLMQTADDLGREGPDYSYGWGLLNVKAAAALLKRDNNVGLRLQKGALINDQVHTYDIEVAEETEELKVSIAWIDQAGSAYAASSLVNDLDLNLIAPDGTVYYPFTLSGLSNPEAPPLKDRANRIDNSEQVHILEPVEGVWQIQVKSHSIQEVQSYSLVSSYNLGIDISEEDAVVAANSVTQLNERSSGSGGGGVFGFHVLTILLMRCLCRKSFKI